MAALLSIASLAAAGKDLGLLDAVKEGNREAVRSLLKDHADVNAPQAYGETALAWAANRDDLEMVELLISAGAKAGVANDLGITPLSLACTNRNEAMVKILLKAGAKPNAPQSTGETPLMTCARTGSAEAVKSLLDQGAEVNAKENERGQTALMWAAARNHADVVRVLIDHGANVHARSATVPLYTPKTENTNMAADYDLYNQWVYLPKVKGGLTPLMFAAQAGALESVRILLKAGAELDASTPDDGTPLVLAACNGHEQTAMFLLEQGANPNAEDGYGLTALHWALQEGIVEIFVRPSATESFWVHPNMPDLVKALLTRGANPNARVKKDFMPYDVHRFGHSRGFNLPQVGLTGATPFLLAATTADLRSMRMLVEGGADPKLATEEGTTPVMVAAGTGPDRRRMSREKQKEFLEAVKLAVQLGGDVNAVTLGGRTALHGAAFLGLTDVVQFLVENGANIEAKDKYGQTPLVVAMGDPDGLSFQTLGDETPDDRFRRRQQPHKETVELLLKLGAKPYVRTPRDLKKY